MDVRKKLLLHALLQVLLLVGIALVANHLSSVAFVRADVTRDQRYTLAEVSRKAVSRLERPLVVRVFYSDGLGAPLNNHKQALLDKLEELRAWSGGRMEVELASPDVAPEDADEARRYGIRPIPYRFKQGNRFEARDVYMGVALLYGERTVPVDLLTAVETFEYQVVKGLRALTQPADARKVVGFSSGNGEVDLLQFPEDNPVGKLVGDLRGAYDLRPVVLGGDDDVPPEVDVLIVNGPEQPLSARAQYQVDQFLMSGKPVAFFVRGLRPDFRTMRVLTVRHDLYALLGAYGVQLNKDVVIDRQHNEEFDVPVVKDGRMRRVKVDYPLIPVTRKLEPGHPVTAGLDAAVLPFTSTITLADPLPSGVQSTVLVATEDEGASRIEGLIYVSPDAFQVNVPGEEQGSFPTMVALTGRFGSYFADKPIPPPQGTRPDDPNWRPDPASKIIDSAPTRLLVAGSADMLANNQALVLNAVDWLVDDTDLLEIRTQLATSERFDVPDRSTSSLIKASIVGAPLLILYSLGLVVLLVARRRA